MLKKVKNNPSYQPPNYALFMHKLPTANHTFCCNNARYAFGDKKNRSILACLLKRTKTTVNGFSYTLTLCVKS